MKKNKKHTYLKIHFDEKSSGNIIFEVIEGERKANEPGKTKPSIFTF